MNDFVTESMESGIQVLCLNRTDKKNAITLDMYQALTNALRSAEHNDQVKVTMLYGLGGDFSSGNDINEFVHIAQTPEKMEAIMAFLQVLSCYKKPLIAGVEGRAVGVGATMLLHCDLVLASREARLQFPFVQLGLVPEAASSHLLPQLVGHQKAFEILVLGEVVSATQAHEMGLVNHLCEEGEAYKLALFYAQRIAALPVEAVALSKDLLKFRGQDDVQMALMREGRIFKDRLRSTEAHQAFTAFLSRNK
ncbi:MULTISPECIES: enoyl-CoA hydratase-related protein [Marinomonas]|uniref:Enoyl-CoA hydratase/isomerase family protein n=1 Tax=Marinomonas arctica TaxID=383750 RepID=A0A7H1J2P1_9GAMM|nr:MULTISPECIES: enoyl-CoA hydratase-related protein [Marinomonas]MCS7486471.1 enoyl-CoA hydratase [Marinomonas sp. BSi20414]QNT04757.1 enoyl-CoA hydratase/isomerase family protein [Marinomonas arctica]GGN30687.1 enoyl-CoA hydratase [Marinomonas arctica]